MKDDLLDLAGHGMKAAVGLVDPGNLLVEISGLLVGVAQLNEVVVRIDQFDRGFLHSLCRPFPLQRKHESGYHKQNARRRITVLTE